jgi:hypothetical protein
MREYQFFESIIEKINSVKCKSNFSCVMPCALLDAQNSRKNSMGHCQLMLENNEKNNKKHSIPLKFEDMGAHLF